MNQIPVFSGWPQIPVTEEEALAFPFLLPYSFRGKHKLMDFNSAPTQPALLSLQGSSLVSEERVPFFSPISNLQSSIPNPPVLGSSQGKLPQSFLFLFFRGTNDPIY